MTRAILKNSVNFKKVPLLNSFFTSRRAASAHSLKLYFRIQFSSLFEDTPGASVALYGGEV